MTDLNDHRGFFLLSSQYNRLNLLHRVCVAAVIINPVIQQRSDQLARLNRITMSGAVTMERFKFYVTGVKVTPTPTPHQ